MLSAEKIREMLFQQLNFMLRRPGICIMCESDLEMQLRGRIYDLYYVDEIEIANDLIIESLIAQGLYYPSNVVNGVFLMCSKI